MTRLSLDLITSQAGFEALAREWPGGGLDVAGQPLPLTWEWFYAWWLSFADRFREAELHVVAIRDAGGILAVAPLFHCIDREDGIPLRVLRSLSNGSSPYWDLVLAPGLAEPVVNDLCRMLTDALDVDLTFLRRVQSHSPLRRWLLDEADSRLQCFDEDCTRSPIVSTVGPWETLNGQLKRKFRSNLRRKLRNFEQTPGTGIERRRLAASTDPLVQELVCISANSWKARHGGDLGTNESRRRFVVSLIDQFGPRGRVSAWIARRDGRAIAYELHFELGGTTFPLLADFDEREKALSPGSVVEYRAIQHAFEDPDIGLYDSCADNYWYLRNWSDTLRTSFDMQLYSKRLRGRLLYALHSQVKPIVRRAFPRRAAPTQRPRKLS